MAKLSARGRHTIGEWKRETPALGKGRAVVYRLMSDMNLLKRYIIPGMATTWKRVEVTKDLAKDLGAITKWFKERPEFRVIMQPPKPQEPVAPQPTTLEEKAAEVADF